MHVRTWATTAASKLLVQRWFERVVILVICANCVTLAMYSPLDPNCETDSCKTLEVPRS